MSTTRIELRMACQGERIKSYKISRNTNRELYDVSIVIDSKEFFASLNQLRKCNLFFILNVQLLRTSKNSR